MNKGIRSYLHVIIQFSAIAYILFSGPKFAVSFLILVELAGLFLGVWALWAMRKSVLSVYPDPEPGFSLIENGPYKLIRHPMYLALFLFLVPLVLSFPTEYRILVLIIFTVNQFLKLHYEENILLKKIRDYKLYSQRTKRIIPFLY